MMPETLPIRLSETRMELAYVEQLNRRHFDEGAKKLMLAVLQEALNNFVQFLDAKTPEHREQFREVDSWFWRDEDEWLFSFNAIAEHLGINPSYFRVGLMRIKQSNFPSRRLAETKLKPFRIGRTAYRTRYTRKSRTTAYA
ncbi:MAG: hypothetical protein OEN50_06430 [Deltaproteobacteria bacterium]|nr:hypothetical protein [Deltaproteobacteria bacterium]